MLFIKEFILIAYVLCIILGGSTLTIALLAQTRGKNEFNRALALFAAGMLVICFYDMAIYYWDYVIGGFNSLKVMRIGNCIIAGTMYLWVAMQEKIIKRQALLMISKAVKTYLLFYMAMWALLTFFFSVEHFYTMKWLLLATDIVLIVSFLTASVAHLIFAATANDKLSSGYMVIVTAMLLWNYISYFWGETSVYWGNSEFIREPLDLTIVFWLIINAASVVYAYRRVFLQTFSESAEEHGKQQDTSDRLEEVCEQFKLTPRERELIELIYIGKSNREIAEMLFLSESTVKTHIYNIFRKMDVKNRIGVICVINGDIEDGQNEQ